MIEIEQFPEVLQRINEELTAGNPVELKIEKDYLTLIRLGRKVRIREPIVREDVNRRSEKI